MYLQRNTISASIAVFDILTSVLQNHRMRFNNRVRCKEIARVIKSILSILSVNVAVEQRQTGGTNGMQCNALGMVSYLACVDNDARDGNDSILQYHHHTLLAKYVGSTLQSMYSHFNDFQIQFSMKRA